MNNTLRKLLSFFLALVILGAGSYAQPDFEEQLQLARQGNAQAQAYIGSLYELGKGVPRDYSEAVKWYRLAADQGYAPAQSSLGSMYALGKGVSQNYQEAVKWYRMAADQGHAVAQFNLGTMYDKGEGVPKDHQEAVK